MTLKFTTPYSNITFIVLCLFYPLITVYWAPLINCGLLFLVSQFLLLDTTWFLFWAMKHFGKEPFPKIMVDGKEETKVSCQKCFEFILYTSFTIHLCICLTVCQFLSQSIHSDPSIHLDYYYYSPNLIQLLNPYP